MWGLRTPDEATAFIFGIEVGTGLFPKYEMSDWLHRDGDPKWGGRGGPGWPDRVARAAVWGQFEPPTGAPNSFTDAENGTMRDAVLDFALAWLNREGGPLASAP